MKFLECVEAARKQQKERITRKSFDYDEYVDLYDGTLEIVKGKERFKKPLEIYDIDDGADDWEIWENNL